MFLKFPSRSQDLHIPVPYKLSHLMKEVSWCVCISSLLQSCSPPQRPSSRRQSSRRTEEWESPASFYLGQCFTSVATYLPLAWFYFLCCFSPLSLPCFSKQASVEKAAWGTVLGIGHMAGTCALRVIPVACYSAWYGGSYCLHVSSSQWGSTLASQVDSSLP